jgi:hypothetical protein
MKSKTNPLEQAQIIKEMGPWVIYYSEAENALYIKTNDYHALPLKMLKSEILDLLANLEKANEGEQNKDILSDEKQTMIAKEIQNT